jgi:hypothetical protein
VSDGRVTFASLDVQMFGVCIVCKQAGWVGGYTRSRLVCEQCYIAGPDATQLRRGGKTGTRRGYTHKTRRPLEESVRLARELHEQGFVIGVIADQMGLSDRTVSNYLSRGSTPEKEARKPAGGAAPLHTKRTSNGAVHPTPKPADNGRPMYGGDPFGYDLRAVLEGAA